MALWALFTFYFFKGYSSTPNLQLKADALLAQRSYNEAAALYENLLSSKATAPSQNAYYYHQLAKISLQTRDFDRALQLLLTGRSHLSPNRQDSLHVENYFLHGLYYYDTEQPKQAMLHFEQALDLAKKVHGNTSRQVALNLLWIGNVYAHKFFQIPMGLQYYEEANKLARHLSEEEAAFLAYNFARVHQTRNDIETSVIYLKRAEAFYSSQPFYGAELADCYNLRALDYMYRGDTTRFFAYEELAISTVQKTGQGRYKLTKYHDNMGAVSKFTGNCSAALGYYKKALNSAVNSKYNQASISNTYLNLGEYFGDCEGKLDSAIFYLKECLAIRKSAYGEKHSETSTTYLHLAQYYASSGLIDSALYFNQQALMSEAHHFDATDITENPVSLGVGYGLELVGALHIKSKLLASRFEEKKNITDLELAFQTLLRADSLLTVHRQSFYWQESKLTYRATLRSIYSRALAYGLKLFEKTQSRLVIEQCFYLMENARYSLLLEDISDMRGNKHKRELHLKKEMAALSQKLQTLPENIDLTKAIVAKKDSVKQQLQAYYDSLGSSGNVFKNFTLASVLDDCSEFLDDQTLVLSFFAAEDAIYTITISHDDVDFYALKRDDELNSYLKSYKQLVSNVPQKNSANGLSAYLKNASHLSSILLPAAIEQYPKLIVIADGPVTNLPFEALFSEKPDAACKGYHCLPYLVKKTAVEYWFSYSVVRQFLQFASRAEQGRLLGIAPEYANELDILPGAAREIADLIEYGADVLKGSTATKQSFLQEVGNYDVIHLAAHAKADTVDGLNSYIDFSRKPDDRLYAYELLSMPFNPRLVVLTACETGEGELKTGEGVYSLGRAFTAAGAKGLILTAWKIPDDATAKLVKLFYSHFLAGDPPAAALQKSKTEFLQEQDNFTAHPYFWSSLYFVGHYSAESNVLKKVSGAVAGGLALLILAIIFFAVKAKARRRSENLLL